MTRRSWTVAALLAGALVACGQPSAPALTTPSSGAVRTGQFVGTTNAGGKIEFTISAIGGTEELEVEYGDITEEGATCTAPDGRIDSQSFPAPTNFLTPTPVHDKRFDLEQTFDAGGYMEKLSVNGLFTSGTSATGTAHAVVLSVDPPNAQCVLARPAVTWSAQLAG